MSLKNSKVMESKIVKQDGALEDLTGSYASSESTWTIEQNAYTARWMERWPQSRNAWIKAMLD